MIETMPPLGHATKRIHTTHDSTHNSSANRTAKRIPVKMRFNICPSQLNANSYSENANSDQTPIQPNYLLSDY